MGRRGQEHSEAVQLQVISACVRESEPIPPLPAGFPKLGVEPSPPHLHIVVTLDGLVAQVPDDPVLRVRVDDLVARQHRPLERTRGDSPPSGPVGGQGLLVVELEPVVRGHAGVGVVGRVRLGCGGRGVVGSVGGLEGGDAVRDAGLVGNQLPQRVMLHLLHRGKKVQVPFLFPDVRRAPPRLEAHVLLRVVTTLGVVPLPRVGDGHHLVTLPVVIVIHLRPSVVADALAVPSVRVAEGEDVDGDAVPRRLDRPRRRFGAGTVSGGVAHVHAVVGREGFEVRARVRASVDVDDGGDPIVDVRAELAPRRLGSPVVASLRLRGIREGGVAAEGEEQRQGRSQDHSHGCLLS
mmetsp:Transcript_28061/g.59615  ORF Transcript_28061/g.59615 Transcript_28061/m.59615 type:complete len:350 (+) Transcript_28061:1541-2590(+)